MHRTLFVVLTLGLAIPAFVLSRVIWPDPPGAPSTRPARLADAQAKGAQR